MKNSQHYS